MIDQETHHIPILLEPIADFLVEGLRALPKNAAPGLILDCTLGGGGHTARILEKMREFRPEIKHRILGIDRDLDAITRNQTRFAKEISEGELILAHASFSESLAFILKEPIYGILADLGISSDQIDSETRGFSFRYPAPLDMRMNTTQGESLLEWLGRTSEREITHTLQEYGEERLAAKIARKLVDQRAKKALPTHSLALAELISSVFPPAHRYKGMHPATRSFQAFRILINQELLELEKLLSDVFPVTHPHGRIAVLSFHSLEDRKVKEAFKNKALYDIPFKKPIEPSDEEIKKNPRSRSAKLRLAIKK